MKHTLFNWTESRHAPVFEHRQLPVTNTQSLSLKTMKSQQYGWRQLIELCGDCFIRY